MDYISQTVGGYGVISIFRDWIRRLVPYFWGDGEIAPNLLKMSRCPHLACRRNQTAQPVKTENILSTEDR